MTREEFESILEEAYMEGYNTAIEDIQEDILDEEAFDLEGEYEYYTEGSISKHPERQMMSRAARVGEKLGVPRDISYRLAQKSAQSAYKHAKNGADSLTALKKGMVDAAKYYNKNVPLHDRINQRAGNDKVYGVGNNRRNRLDAAIDVGEKVAGKTVDRNKILGKLKKMGYDREKYNG